MAQSSKSMLEAFKASGSTAPVQDGTSHPKSKAKTPPAAAGGPFAAEPPVRGEPTPAIEEGVQALAATQRLRIATMGAALVAALGIGWMIGSPREVVATEEVPVTQPIDLPELGTSLPVEPSTPASAAPASQPPSAPVEAIMDPRNKHTIIAATYGTGKQNLANDTVRHLESEGFAAWLVAKGNSIYLLVEATPTVGELDGLLADIKKTAGPNGEARAFETAYVVNIDSYLQR